jgi:hypothetical protein
VENNGSSPIVVSRFIYEFPQTIHVNQGSPFDNPPILRVEKGGLVDGVQYWKLTLTKYNNAPVRPPYWTLPEYISPGDFEVFLVPASYIKEDPSPEAKINLKLYLKDGTMIEKATTVAELFEPEGPYSPPAQK